MRHHEKGAIRPLCRWNTIDSAGQQSPWRVMTIFMVELHVVGNLAPVIFCLTFMVRHVAGVSCRS